MTRSRRPTILVGLTMAMLLAAAPVHAAAPTNDGAAGAVDVVAPSTTSVDLTEATLDGDPQYCGSGTASVWYRYTAPADTLLTVTLGPDNGTGAMHLGRGDPSAFEACLFAGWSQQFALTSGEALYLQVSTDGSPTSFELGALSLLDNDRFAGAESIGGLPATIAPDLTRATSIGDPGTCSGAPGAWYRLDPDTDQRIDITPSSEAYVTVVGASPSDVLQCLYPWNGRQRISLSGGSTYHLVVHSNSPSEAGTPVTIDAVPPPPGNDDRAGAQDLHPLPADVTADLRSATPDSDSSECFDSDWPSVWYRYTPTADELVSVEVRGGSGQAAALLRYDDVEDDGRRCTRWVEGTAIIRAGSTLEIALGAPPSVDPSVGMTVSASPAPTIDVTILGNGTVERVAGVAVISGRATCSVAGQADVHVEARQRVGRTTLVTGDGHSSFSCGPTPSPFTVRVPGDGAPFGSGSVAISFEAHTGEWPIQASDSGTATVKLRGQ